MLLVTKGNNPAELTYEESKSEGDGEGDHGSQNGVGDDIEHILPEILLLEIVPTRKYHRRQQPIKKDLLIELQLFLPHHEIHKHPKDKANYYSRASLMNEVPLDMTKLT